MRACVHYYFLNLVYTFNRTRYNMGFLRYLRTRVHIIIILFTYTLTRLAGEEQFFVQRDFVTCT